MHSRTILRNYVLFYLVSSLIALFAINQTSQAQHVNGTWGLVGTHPQAAQQPANINGSETFAQYLWSLKVWNGRLYAGYGDFGANGVSFIGTKFAITPFDPNTGSFASIPVFLFDAESVPLYRDIAGRLYAPNMDASDNSNSNFAVGTNTGVWEDHREQRAFHIFDMATLNGTDVWMVGSDCVVLNGTTDCTKSDAVAWRSTDGGNTFQESLRVHPPDGFGVARFYFAGVLNNHLYVQQVDTSPTTTTAQDHSLVFDGSTWSNGPDLFPKIGNPPARPDLSAHGYHPVFFNGQMVYMTRHSYANDNSTNRKQLVAFDGTSATYVDIPPIIRNFTVDGNYLYGLAANGEVRRTITPSLSWESWESFTSFTEPDTLRPTRKAGHSIAVLNGKLYIGTSQAQLYRFSTTSNPIDDARFFVRQSYFDILRRLPDAAWEVWISYIDGCGGDSQCRNTRRITTTRGLLESLEFRQSHPILLNNNQGTQAYNEEYVLQLYLCLLQRQPDGAISQWLSYINSTGDYDGLVGGFINSSEYRARFQF